MVYLAPVREALDVPYAIGNALGYQFSGERTPEQQLGDFLRNKELLLCLDNFEHLLDSAPLVANLLAAAPQLRVVITSREPLRLKGEQTYVLEPLPVTAGAGEHSEAELLFADRAALVHRGFALTPENSPEVRHFCEHMSGIPLAIELAAAWMDSFTLAELHDELTDQLELEARTSDQEPRHQSLKASLDWSWNLLGGEQQEILMRLSTFRGGFFSEAACAVLNIKGMALRTVLAKLCDKSWLYTREVDGQTRFFLRDMLAHEYALDKLKTSAGQDCGLCESATTAHAAFFTALAELEGKNLHGSGTPDGGEAQLRALASWRADYQNIDEALDTALNQANIDWLVLIARHLRDFLAICSDFFAMRDRSHRLLRAAQGLASRELELEALLNLGQALHRLGGISDSRRHLTRAMAIARELGDQQGEALSLLSLGFASYFEGDSIASRDFCTQALAIARQMGSRVLEARALNGLSFAESLERSFNSQREFHRQSLAIAREIGNLHIEAIEQNNLGFLESQLKNYGAAQELLGNALAASRKLGDRNLESIAMNNLGSVEFFLGNYLAARENYGRALATKHEMGDLRCVCFSIACAAASFSAAGAMRSAAISIYGGFALAASISYCFPPSEQTMISEAQNRIDAALAAGRITAEQLAEWRATGEAMGLDDLVQFILDELDKLKGEVSAAKAAAEA
jgi:predicted ATPase